MSIDKNKGENVTSTESVVAFRSISSGVDARQEHICLQRRQDHFPAHDREPDQETTKLAKVLERTFIIIIVIVCLYYKYTHLTNTLGFEN